MRQIHKKTAKKTRKLSFNVPPHHTTTTSKIENFDSKFSFIVIGDWGMATDGQFNVAQHLGKVFIENESQFVISTGGLCV